MLNLARNIITTPWMIHSPSVEAMLPQIMSMLNGNVVNFNQPKSEHYTTYNSSNTNRKVAVLEIKGVIMKEDQDCGPRGTQSMNEILKNYANDDSVVAIVLDIDTPGGQATFLETLGNTLNSIDKPIVTYYSGLCASAGYHIASNSNEIYASEPTDIVGSIGSMMSLLDNTKQLLDKGLTLHQIYADQSENKNQMFQKAMNGDYSELQKKLLNPFAESFINRVKSNRAIDNQEVFKGGTYMSSEAQELGLIDGVKTFEEVIDRALELANVNNSNNQNTNMKNKFTTIEAVLGFEENSIQAVDNHVSLSVENLAAVNDGLKNSQDANELLVASETSLKANLVTATSQVTDLEKSVSEKDSEITELKAKVTALEVKSSTGKTTTSTASNEFDDGKVDTWDDPNNQFNKRANADLA